MPANRQTVPRADREAAIVGCARDAFLDDGFDATTVAGIARRAGMTSANVHYYFSTKEALFAAVARQAYDDLFAELDRKDDPVARLQGYVEFHLSFHPIRAEFQAIAARSPEVAELLVRRESWLATTAGAVADHELDAAVLAATVTGLIEASRPRADAERVLAHAVASLTHRST